MSFWSQIAGQATDMGFGLLGGLGASGIEYGFGRAAAEDQMDMARRLAKKYPSWHAEGLERAGLNRILAVRPGGASPPSPGMIPTPQVGSNVAKMTQATAVKSQIDNVRANTRVSEQQRRNLELDAAMKQRDLTQRDFQIIRQAIETSWLQDPQFRAAIRGRAARGSGLFSSLNAIGSQVIDYLERVEKGEAPARKENEGLWQIIQFMLRNDPRNPMNWKD